MKIIIKIKYGLNDETLKTMTLTGKIDPVSCKNKYKHINIQIFNIKNLSEDINTSN